jgi:hypothetical protein
MEQKLQVAAKRELQLLEILAKNNIPQPELFAESDIAEFSRSTEVTEDL